MSTGEEVRSCSTGVGVGKRTHLIVDAGASSGYAVAPLALHAVEARVQRPPASAYGGAGPGGDEVIIVLGVEHCTEVVDVSVRELGDALPAERSNHGQAAARRKLLRSSLLDLDCWEGGRRDVVWCELLLFFGSSCALDLRFVSPSMLLVST